MGDVKLELAIKGLITERPASTANGIDGRQAHVNHVITPSIMDLSDCDERIAFAKELLSGQGTMSDIGNARELVVSGANSTATANEVLEITEETAGLTGHISSQTAQTSVYFQVWEGNSNLPESEEDITEYEASESPLDFEETSGGADVSYVLTGLTAETDYSFRVKVVNEYTTIYSASEQFTTLALTEVTADEVVAPTDTTAELTGSVVLYMPEADISFEVWEGSNPVPSNSTLHDADESPITESGNVSFSLTGLTAETTYSFRIVAVTDDSTVYSSSIDFTTDVAE